MIRINSSEATTYYYRGIAKSKLNLFKDAIDDFTDAMLHKIKDVDAFFQRGYARLKIEDNENALLDFTRYGVRCAAPGATPPHKRCGSWRSGPVPVRLRARSPGAWAQPTSSNATR